MPGIRTVKLDFFHMTPETQPRVRINDEVVDEYAESVRIGKKLPPVTAFKDDENMIWLADGYHRVQAYRKAGLNEINTNLLKGTKRDAILFAVGANTEHGQRRTNADKRRAVETVLNDSQWNRWSNRKIAEQCAVSDRFVGELRDEMTANGSQSGEPEQPRQGRDGRTIKTAKIGKAETPNLATVNGHHAPDPPDVAKARAAGKIPAGTVVDVREPAEATSLADVTEDIAEEASKADDGLSDSDWVKGLPLAAVLKGTQLKVFAADALVYRELEKPRGAFRHHASRALKGSDKGEYAWKIRRFLRIDHPKSWLRCPATENGGCGGTGAVPVFGECPKCKGKGYWINS